MTSKARYELLLKVQDQTSCWESFNLIVRNHLFLMVKLRISTLQNPVMDYQLLTWLTYYNNSISIQFILHIYIFNYLVSSIYKCIFLGKQYFVENSILLVNYLILSIPLANPKQIHHSVLLCFSITTSQNNTNRLVRRADFSSQDKQINYSNCWFIIL